MRAVFLLRKENIKLAESEVLALISGEKIDFTDNVLIAENESRGILKRLAFTEKVYLYLFSCTLKNIKREMNAFDWNSIYKKNFSLRIINLSGKIEFKEKDLAGIIWRNVKKPRVDLEKPKTAIELLVLEKEIVAGLLIYTNKEKFGNRKAHKRPAHHPTSMHPKLARCLVNLTGAKEGEEIVDPFCGSGGVLIEAGLMGLKPTGYDIEKKLVEKARTNLMHYKIKDFRLEKKNALKLDRKIRYIVTDLPYGRNTNVKNLERLYDGFLRKARIILERRAVIAFPDNVRYRKLILRNKLKIRNVFDWYLHKSLSKKICVIEK